MNPDRKSQAAGILFVLAAITVWGAYFPLAKIILSRISPDTFLVLRLGVGELTLYLLNLHLQKSLRFSSRDWVYITLAGMIGIVLHQWLQLNGLKVTSATNVGWILTLIPPVTGILGWIVLKEPVVLRKALGVVVAMFGVSLLISRGDLGDLSIGRNRGDLLSLASVGTWSMYTIILKSRLGRCEPLAVAAAHMMLGFLFFGATGAGHFVPEVSRLDAGEWAITIFIGVVPSGLAYYWWAAGLQRLSALDTSMFLFIEAIVASLTAWIILDESFTLAMLGAAAIIVLGVWIAQTQRLGRKTSSG
jgi:drug/metabolite transporter (DMT)-like permease